MGNKLSAYQKLKAENLKLKQDIYVLTQLEKSKKPEDMIKFFSVRTQWDIRFKLEDSLWKGDYSEDNKFTGLLNKIT